MGPDDCCCWWWWSGGGWGGGRGEFFVFVCQSERERTREGGGRGRGSAHWRLRPTRNHASGGAAPGDGSSFFRPARPRALLARSRGARVEPRARARPARAIARARPPGMGRVSVGCVRGEERPAAAAAARWRGGEPEPSAPLARERAAASASLGGTRERAREGSLDPPPSPPPLSSPAADLPAQTARRCARGDPDAGVAARAGGGEGRGGRKAAGRGKKRALAALDRFFCPRSPRPLPPSPPARPRSLSHGCHSCARRPLSPARDQAITLADRARAHCVAPPDRRHARAQGRAGEREESPREKRGGEKSCWGFAAVPRARVRSTSRTLRLKLRPPATRTTGVMRGRPRAAGRASAAPWREATPRDAIVFFFYHATDGGERRSLVLPTSGIVGANQRGRSLVEMRCWRERF
jgi:hypothetical protein